MQNKATIIDELLLSLSNRTVAISKLSHDYGTGEQLFAAEIHLIERIHDYPGKNTTDLAQLIGVSKVAISTMAKNLQQKGYIRKYNTPDNKKEVYYALTESGLVAYTGHKAFHEKQNRAIFRRMENFTEEEADFLIGFLHEYIRYLNDYYAAKGARHKHQ